MDRKEPTKHPCMSGYFFFIKENGQPSCVIAYCILYQNLNPPHSYASQILVKSTTLICIWNIGYLIVLTTSFDKEQGYFYLYPINICRPLREKIILVLIKKKINTCTKRADRVEEGKKQETTLWKLKSASTASVFLF